MSTHHEVLDDKDELYNIGGVQGRRSYDEPESYMDVAPGDGGDYIYVAPTYSSQRSRRGSTRMSQPVVKPTPSATSINMINDEELNRLATRLNNRLSSYRKKRRSSYRAQPPRSSAASSAASSAISSATSFSDSDYSTTSSYYPGRRVYSSQCNCPRIRKMTTNVIYENEP